MKCDIKRDFSKIFKKMNHLPSGQDDFKQLIDNNNLIYIDKTYFIKEWWESSYEKVTLITRPRRFGKTLNMSMIDYFFSNQYENTRYLFDGLFISTENSVMEHQGQYPVIYLNFGDIKTGNCESIKNQIKMKIWQVYLNYKKQMIDSQNLDLTEKEFINSITYQMNDDIAMHSIQCLCSFLNKVYADRSTIVLLDEYDSILTKSWQIQGNNDEIFEIKNFFLNFICSTFQDNKFLKRGLLTGIMNVPLSSNFDGCNNVNVYTIASDKYSKSFGFTSEELNHLIEKFNLETLRNDIEKWYDGYRFGNDNIVNIFNPWSIVQIINNPNHFSSFLMNSSSNDLIKEILKESSMYVKDCMVKLIQGEIIEKEISETIVFNNCYENNNEESIWILLLSFGYLTFVDRKSGKNGSKLCFALKLPNLEVLESFAALINEWFEGRNFFMNDFVNNLISGNLNMLQQFVDSFLVGSLSFFSHSFEVVCHAFVLGIVSHVRASFHVDLSSNNRCLNVLIESLNREQFNVAFILSFLCQGDNEDDQICPQN